MQHAGNKQVLKWLAIEWDFLVRGLDQTGEMQLHLVSAQILVVQTFEPAA